MTDKPVPLIAPRVNEDDDELRFREAMGRLGGQIMQTLDAAIMLRSAAPDTQRSRHLVRGEVTTALLRALNTFHLHRATGPMPRTIKPRSK